MKNVKGLTKAIQIVRNACASDEICILGNFPMLMPTAQELLGKCISYINKMYECDILNEIVADFVARNKGTDNTHNYCNDCSNCPEQDMVNEDEDEQIIVVVLGDVEDIVDTIICDNMGYLNKGLIEDIVKKIKSYYESIDGNLAEDYYTDYSVDGVYAALCDCIDIADFDKDYIDDIVSKIVREIDEKCISIE